MKPAPGDPSWVQALAATMLIQTCSSYLSRLTATLGPPVAAAAKVDEAVLGYLAAAGTLGSILFLACGGPVVKRFGPIRSLQWGLLVSALGAALLMLGAWPALLLSSLLIGVGYGPSAPAGSDVLARFSPARHRNLLFSVKQAGVPIGGVLAGLILPVTFEAGGLVLVLLVSVGAALATVLAVQPLRPAIDRGRDVSQRVDAGAILSLENLRGPFAVLSSARDLRRFATAGSCLAVGQGCWFAFMVTFLVQDLGLSLTLAGAVFAAMQAAGIVGRIGLGWVADRLGSGVPVLRVLALASGLSSLALAMARPDWPSWLLLLVAIGAGLTVSGWNGIQLAEIARRAPSAKVGDYTSGASLLVFLGYIIGPVGFALTLWASDSFRLAYLLAAAVAAAAVLPLAWVDAARPMPD